MRFHSSSVNCASCILQLSSSSSLLESVNHSLAYLHFSKRPQETPAMALESGHEVVALEGEELARQEKDFVGFNHGLARLRPGNWFLPAAYSQFADKIFNFEWDSNDVLVMGYPRCGTSWLQEIVWTMRNNPDLDQPMAALPIMGRSPYLEMDIMMDGRSMPPVTPENPMVKVFMQMCPGGNPADGVCLQMAAAMPKPRTLKSHLPFSLLNPNILDTVKVVYIARNCRDTVVSLHHHCRLLKTFGYSGSLEDFVPYFLNDEVVYGPYCLHLKEAWEMNSHANVLFIFYEDLKHDIQTEINKINDFLGTGLSHEQLDKVIKHTSFAEMQLRDNLIGSKSHENPMMNPVIVEESGGFFRKGEVGDWQEKLTPEMVEKLDEWIEKNLEIPFKYTI